MPKRRKCPNPECGEPILVSTATVCSACHRRFSEFEPPVKPATASLFGEDEVEVNEVVRPKRVPRKLTRKKTAEPDGIPSLFDPVQPGVKVQHDLKEPVEEPVDAARTMNPSPVDVDPNPTIEREVVSEERSIEPFAVHSSAPSLNQAKADSFSSHTTSSTELGREITISPHTRSQSPMNPPSRSRPAASSSVSWSGFFLTLMITSLVCLVIGLLFWQKMHRSTGTEVDVVQNPALHEQDTLQKQPEKPKPKKIPQVEKTVLPDQAVLPKKLEKVPPKPQLTAVDLLIDLQQAKTLREIQRVGVFSTLIDPEVLRVRDWIRTQDIDTLKSQPSLGENYFEWNIGERIYTLQLLPFKGGQKINLDALDGVSKFFEHPIWNFPDGSKEGTHTFYVIAKDSGLEKTSLGVNWLWVSASVHNDQPYHMVACDDEVASRFSKAQASVISVNWVKAETGDMFPMVMRVEQMGW